MKSNGFVHSSEKPEQTLRNEIRKNCDGVPHQSAGDSRTWFYQPCYGVYGLYEWKTSQYNLETDAEQITTVATSNTTILVTENFLDKPESLINIQITSALEGRELLRLHRQKERKPRLTLSKKQTVLSLTGRLLCEVCEFDFSSFYGPLGDGFAECHHLTPLAKLNGSTPTELDDLSIVCANCHRMLHRSLSCSIEELRKIVQTRKPQ